MISQKDVHFSTSFRVAIIGAGVSGITTAKQCLENNLSFVVFERTCNVAGLWRFRKQVESGQGSVMQTTIVNSSKIMTAFSDFPMPTHFPNFMHNRLMHQYLQLYCNSFGFEKFVRFEHQVLSVENCNERDGYVLNYCNTPQSTIHQEHFDAVAICTGLNHTPKIISFPDQHKFKGPVIHSHEFRAIDSFLNKTVVVVGIGNSGGDIAVDLAPITRQVYLSSRRGGTWLVRRNGLDGYPIDTLTQRRWLDSFMNMMPLSVRSFLAEMTMQKLIGHELIGLKPNKARFYQQHIMVNDHLPSYIHQGFVKIRDNIERFTEDGVIFEGSNGHVTKCDSVILCTGYQLSIPFLPKSLVDWDESGKLDLYKHMFDPKQPKPERLAFIGLPKPIGSLPPISEIQSRWFVSLLTDQCPRLLNSKKMMEKIEKRRQYVAKRYGKEEKNRYTFEVDWLPYMDSIARKGGFKPTLWKTFFYDPILWYCLVFKPAIPAQFRLQGPGAKTEQARQLIMSIEEQIKAPYKKSSTNDSDPNEQQTLIELNGEEFNKLIA